MIKTIKVEKQLRLDELIKFVWDNDIQNERFRSKESDVLVLVEHGRVFTEWTIDKCETFTVEVEEPITEDTVFQNVVIIFLKGIKHMTPTMYYSIRSIRRDYPSVAEIHTLINGKLKLIWEAE